MAQQSHIAPVLPIVYGSLMCGATINNRVIALGPVATVGPFMWPFIIYLNHFPDTQYAFLTITYVRTSPALEH